MLNEQTIKEKLDFYTKKDIELHIVKKDREWFNCFIVEKESDNVYVIKERKLGLKHLFVSEIYDIDEVKSC